MEHELHPLAVGTADVQEDEHCLLIPFEQVVELQFGDLAIGLLYLFVELPLLYLFVAVVFNFLQLFLDVLDVAVVPDDVARIDLALEQPFV